MKHLVRKALHRLGYDVIRYPPPHLSSRAQLIRHFGIDVVLDVGANVGQYAQELRAIGYGGRIISFEPIPDVFDTLKKVAENDPNWQTYPFGLGDAESAMSMGVTKNLMSSSLFPLASQHPDDVLRPVRNVSVLVKRLDTVWPLLSIEPENRILLKLDVQGFEKRVLDGATNVLDSIAGLQIELCFEQVYDGAMLFDEMKAFLSSQGFVLHSVEPGYTHPDTGKMIEADGLFFKKGVVQ